MNFKDYTKYRDIVVKRNKRAVEAGLASPVHFPTVREIKAGLVTPSEAMRAVKDFYSSGSQVKAIRQTGLVPTVKEFPILPEIKITSDERKEKRREQQRLYRQRRKIRDWAGSPERSKKYEGYLKALETVSKTWKKAGRDIGIDLRSLTPSQAQAFVEYMDYRFSQGDFTQRYVIDEFVQDFSKLLSAGHSANSIIADFNQFLEDRSVLEDHYSSMEGISSGEIQSIWDEFIGE